MDNEFVPFELAIKLKEKGFNEKCYHYYQKEILLTDNCWNRYNIGTLNRCSAPTISQVLKWLRKEKCLHIEILHIFSEETLWDFEVVRIGSYERWWNNIGLFDNYELAALAGVNYCLENLI